MGGNRPGRGGVQLSVNPGFDWAQGSQQRVEWRIKQAQPADGKEDVQRGLEVERDFRPDLVSPLGGNLQNLETGFLQDPRD